MHRDITTDMRDDARRHHRSKGYVRMADGSFLPEHLTVCDKDPARKLSEAEILERLRNRRPFYMAA
jgi:hypothetical protein